MPRVLERPLFFILITAMLWAAAMRIEATGITSRDFQKPASCRYFAGQPIVDVELAAKRECFRDVVEQGAPERLQQNAQALRSNTYMDFVFLALYWAAFVLLALLHEGAGSGWVIGLISLAALFDIFENWRILSGLSGVLRSGNAEGILPGYFSLVKWLAFGLALVVLGVFRWSSEKRWRRVLPIALIAAGVLTLSGLMVPSVMTYSGYAFGVVFLAAIACFWPFSADASLVGIEYAYLMRFQLVAALILAAGLPVGYRVIPSLFIGLFDGRGFWSSAFIVWAAFQLAWTIMVTCRLVLIYGPERFVRTKLADTESQEPIGPKPVGAKTVAAFGALALPLVVVLYVGTAAPGGGAKMLAALLGLVAALGVLVLTASLHFAIEEDARHSAELIFPSFGFLTRKGRLSQSSFWEAAGKSVGRLPSDLTAGILDGKRLRSGHEMATIALGVFVVIFLAVGVWFSPRYASPERQPAALFFLLLLLTVLTWLLSGAAFFLDRTRLPVFTTLLVVSLFTGFFRTDHEFQVTEKGNREVLGLRPTDVVHYWEHSARRKGSQTIVVVATAGGGIRAAAWTAEVMTRLQEGCERLSASLLLVSSVSGGSVGSMFVVGPYSGNGEYPSTDPELQKIRFNASRSSLSAVGWGLAYPDLARTAPVVGSAIPETLDRGWSLENAWETDWRDAKLEPPTMRQWREDVSHGMRPAVIFNATVSETGERFLVASTDTSSEGTQRFFELFPSGDLDVATAARLSASFPYVSPLARPSEGPVSKGYHIGDGGYYDNSGLLSAVEWLRDAGAALSPYEVVVVLIDAKPDREKDGSLWSWQKQMVGPLETLLHVRTSSQQLRDSIELNMATDFLAAQPERVIVKPTRFLFSSNTPVPLSWHLTDWQIGEISRSWEDAENVKARDFVYGELGCATHPQ